jgi:hypothetical protein
MVDRHLSCIRRSFWGAEDKRSLTAEMTKARAPAVSELCQNPICSECLG